MSSVTGQAMGSGAVQSSASSAPENAATTPSAARAFVRSTPRMRACAYGLRTTAIQTMPGIVMSSTKLPWPVSSRASSLRGTEVPMSVCVASSVIVIVRSSDRGGRLPDGLDDVDVAGAATEVALQRLSDLCLARVGPLLQQAHRGHHESGRAVAALERVLLVVRLLDRMELPVLGQPFDRGHVAAVGLDREQRARLDGLAVEQHRAGSARGRIAADMRARQSEALTHEVYEQLARLHVRLVPLAVDGKRNLSHLHSPSSSRAGASPRAYGLGIASAEYDWPGAVRFGRRGEGGARARVLPGRSRARDGGLPGAAHAQAAAARRRARGREDRGREDARDRTRRRADPTPVLRGHRRGTGTLRVGLLTPAAVRARLADR